MEQAGATAAVLTSLLEKYMSPEVLQILPLKPKPNPGPGPGPNANPNPNRDWRCFESSTDPQKKKRFFVVLLNFDALDLALGLDLDLDLDLDFSVGSFGL